MTETPDPLAGSYYVESLTNELEAAAWAYLDEIEAMGGTLAAIEGGFQQRQIQEAAYRVQRAIESGDQVVVGVNRFRDDEVTTPALHRIDPDGERRQIERVRRVRAERSAEAWTAAMDRLEATARGDGNLMPPILDGGPRLRHGRRDQRPAAGRLGRAPRAHHGLTDPSGIRQWPCQRPSAPSSQHLEPGDPVRGTGGVGGRRRRCSSSGASLDSAIVRCGMTSSNAPAVRRVVREPARRIASVSAGERRVRLGREVDDAPGTARRARSAHRTARCAAAIAASVAPDGRARSRGRRGTGRGP